MMCIFLKPGLIWQGRSCNKEHTCQLSQQVVFQPSLNTIPVQLCPSAHEGRLSDLPNAVAPPFPLGGLGRGPG